MSVPSPLLNPLKTASGSHPSGAASAPDGVVIAGTSTPVVPAPARHSRSQVRVTPSAVPLTAAPFHSVPLRPEKGANAFYLTPPDHTIVLRNSRDG